MLDVLLTSRAAVVVGLLLGRVFLALEYFEVGGLLIKVVRLVHVLMLVVLGKVL
jgi:hypothetical protein